MNMKDINEGRLPQMEDSYGSPYGPGQVKKEGMSFGTFMVVLVLLVLAGAGGTYGGYELGVMDERSSLEAERSQLLNSQEKVRAMYMKNKADTARLEAMLAEIAARKEAEALMDEKTPHNRKVPATVVYDDRNALEKERDAAIAEMEMRARVLEAEMVMHEKVAAVRMFALEQQHKVRLAEEQADAELREARAFSEARVKDILNECSAKAQ